MFVLLFPFSLSLGLCGWSKAHKVITVLVREYISVQHKCRWNGVQLICILRNMEGSEKHNSMRSRACEWEWGEEIKSYEVVAKVSVIRCVVIIWWGSPWGWKYLCQCFPKCDQENYLHQNWSEFWWLYRFQGPIPDLIEAVRCHLGITDAYRNPDDNL